MEQIVLIQQKKNEKKDWAVKTCTKGSSKKFKIIQIVRFVFIAIFYDECVAIYHQQELGYIYILDVCIAKNITMLDAKCILFVTYNNICSKDVLCNYITQCFSLSMLLEIKIFTMAFTGFGILSIHSEPFRAFGVFLFLRYLCH